MSSPPQPLLDFLQTKHNPFARAIARDRDREFLQRSHVEEINGSALQQIRAIIHKYRSAGLRSQESLVELNPPPSGAAIVVGERGSGKTHLVKLLCATENEATIIAPHVYEQARSFPEYLALQTVYEFQAQEQAKRGVTQLEHCCEWFARYATRMALQTASAPEWLAHCAALSSETMRRKRLTRHHFLRQFKELNEHLSTTRSIIDCCKLAGVEPAILKKLAMRHVVKNGPQGDNSLNRIRVRLFLHLIQSHYSGQMQPLLDFLLDGYAVVARSAGDQFARRHLVEALLQCLSETFMMAGRPLVFFFDSLETLLKHVEEKRLISSFFHGICEVLDDLDGCSFPFVIFAERGFLRDVVADSTITDFATHRLTEGISVNGTTIAEIELDPVGPHHLGRLVAKRMAPLLSEYFHDASRGEGSDILPFDREDLAAIATREGGPLNLRQQILMLRDSYSEIVRPPGPSEVRASGDLEQQFTGTGRHSEDGYLAETPEAETEDSTRTEIICRVWKEQCKKAERQLADNSFTTLSTEIHLGFVRWFEALAAENVTTEAAQRLRQAEAEYPGEHPTYGQMIRCHLIASDGGRQEIGVAFFLAGGSGMPCDLRAKFEIAHSKKAKADKLVILWQRNGVSEPVCEALPVKSKNIWLSETKAVLQTPVVLKALEIEALQTWIAITLWEAALGEFEDAISSEERSHFIAEQTKEYLHVLQ